MSASDRVSELIDRPAGFVWRRAGVGVVVLIVVLVGVGFVWQWLGHEDSSSRLFRDTIAALDASDPDWRLEGIERTRVNLPEADNSARVVVKAFSLLGGGFPPAPLDETFRHVEHAPNVRLDAARARLLERELFARATALAEARRLAGMPRGRHHLSFGAHPLTVRLNDQNNTRPVAALLQFDAMNRAHEGDIRGALESCRAALNAGRSLDDEPFIISQFIRMVCISVACNAVERVLAQGEAADGDLALLQKLLELEEKHPTLLVAFRGERALLESNAST
jgi:hypothetical protein